MIIRKVYNYVKIGNFLNQVFCFIVLKLHNLHGVSESIAEGKMQNNWWWLVLILIVDLTLKVD